MRSTREEADGSARLLPVACDVQRAHGLRVEAEHPVTSVESAESLVYFGLAVHSVDHVETILDEDRNDAYKLLAIRVRATG